MDRRGAAAARVAGLFVTALIAACGGDDNGADGAVIEVADGADYEVDADPRAFSSVVDNPYYPLQPGMRWVYEETGDEGEVEITTVDVLDETRVVSGVEAIVVHDVVTSEDGTVIEDTYDWFAQHEDGAVWYLGEDTTAFDGGQPDKAGSWEWGRDGALPGVVMPADPEVSDTGYRQEFYEGEAEDLGQVIDVGATVSVPAGDFGDVVRTRDWNPLEPDVIEEKSYAPGVGFVHEVKTAGEGTGNEVVLVEFLAG